MKNFRIFLAVLFVLYVGGNRVSAQCTSADIMEPGFNFITSSRGCAPFTIEIQTLYLNSTPGTVYHVDWGDGSPVWDYMQVNSYPNGPIISHEYVDAPVDCGYQVIIEAENPCNPLGSVVLEPINVIVWTEDLVFSDPDIYRVCQGFASSIKFTDDSDWNCFPRADARENADPRWIQWIYGKGSNANRIQDVRIDGALPGGFPYYDPSLGTKPVYPVTDVDQQSLNVQIPVTAPADIGKDFYIKLNNWNACNQYDEDLSNGAVNPITPGGDNPPRVSESRIVIVDAPDPDFVARKENSSNDISWDYCIGDIIYFDNESTGPGGSALSHTWEFYNGPNISDGLLESKTENNPLFSYDKGGPKLVRLIVGDNNAVGGCQATVEKIVNITPTSIAQISASGTRFCKNPGSSETFEVTFTDVSIGSTINTEWKWEFYDENGVLIREEPNAGFSSEAPVPYVQDYSNPGVYQVVLISRDIITLCDSRDELNIVVYNNPEPSFTATGVCEGLSTEIIDNTTLKRINDSQVIRWEWDFSYDNVTFNPDSVFDGSMPDTLIRKFNYGTYQVALRATNDQNGCNAIFTTPVEIYQNPVAAFIKDSVEGCSPLNVILENTVANTQAVAMDEYVWSIDYGDGYIDTIRNDPDAVDYSSSISLTFENWSISSKSFGIILKSISDKGCEVISDADSIRVLPSVKPGFYYENYNPLANNCAPVEVNFQIDDFTLSLLPNEFTWTVCNDDEEINSKNVNSSISLFTHTFEAAGSGINRYSIKLDAEIDDMCVGDSTLFVNVNPVPIADFTIDTLEFGCERMVLEIDANQKGLLEYYWTIDKGGMLMMNNSFGDNFIYEVERPAAGTPDLELTMNLRTSNYAFCESGVTSANVMIPPKPLLNASFEATPEVQIFPNATISLKNTSLHTNATHLWGFGDENTSALKNPGTHTYEEAGNYIIKLKLEESYCLSEDSLSISIQPAAPIADFKYDPGQGCAPLTVNFTNLTQYGDPDLYRWYFGEGERVVTSEHPSHTYYEPGIYSVKLEAANSAGETDFAIKKMIIEVYDLPHADFSIRPETVKLPEFPIYTTNLSFDADDYYWDFGDGTFSDEFEPSHIYVDTGHYDITLIASTAKGCIDTVTYENIVEVIEGNDVLIPNAFTPSLDGPTGGSRYTDGGRNDVFYPVTEGVIAYDMQIFNRWGELLFSTADTGKGWDGYYKGRLCAPDVYIYKINFKFIDGREEMKYGDITLIR